MISFKEVWIKRYVFESPLSVATPLCAAAWLRYETKCKQITIITSRKRDVTLLVSCVFNYWRRQLQRQDSVRSLLRRLDAASTDAFTADGCPVVESPPPGTRPALAGLDVDLFWPTSTWSCAIVGRAAWFTHVSRRLVGRTNGRHKLAAADGRTGQARRKKTDTRKHGSMEKAALTRSWHLRQCVDRTLQVTAPSIHVRYTGGLS